MIPTRRVYAYGRCRSIHSMPMTDPSGPTGVSVAASSHHGASRRRIATKISAQSVRYPIPWLMPNQKVGPSSPGIASCIRSQIFGMGFPAHPRLDISTTVFKPE